MKTTSLKLFQPTLATTLGIGSWRLVLLLATAVSLFGYPKAASAATAYVRVGWYGGLIEFFPSSVTIHPGDQVQWIWLNGPHSITSGTFNSGVRNYPASFTHMFNSLGTFPYHCTRHPGPVGQVIVKQTPIVTTNPAAFIASFSATLKASLNPDGLSTTFHFEYGTTMGYGLTTAPQTQTGNTSRPVSANINILTASTTYHFRIVASNAAGTSFGSDRTFTTLTTTGSPVVTTNPATNVTASAATLHGSLDPHGLTTTVHFQYGTTTSYGRTTAMVTQSGNMYRNIAANISGLAMHTTYHFRIVATNSGGTRVGRDRTFTTP